MDTSDPIGLFNAKAEKNGWGCVCAPTLAFRRPELIAAAKLWAGKAQDSIIPSRTDFDARSLKPFLAHMSILEQVQTPSGLHFRSRLHGTTHAIMPDRIETGTYLVAAAATGGLAQLMIKEKKYSDAEPLLKSGLGRDPRDPARTATPARSP